MHVQIRPWICVSALLLGVCAMSAADKGEFSIKWLPMPEAKDPSAISNWKAAILSYTQPVRDKLLGPPATLVIQAEFHTLKMTGSARSILPMATATNHSGLLGTVLTSRERVKLQHAIKTNGSITMTAAPRLTIPEGMRAKISDGKNLHFDGATYLIGQSIELLLDTDGNQIQIRAVAEMTGATTNLVDGIEQVLIEPVFQAALEAGVADGGAVAVWRPNADSVGQLVIVVPQLMSSVVADPATNVRRVPGTNVQRTPK